MAKGTTKEDFRGRDVVSIEDFLTEEINYILEHAEKIEKNPQDFLDSMNGKII